MSLPDDTRLGRIALTVRDLEGQVEFYTGALGLEVLESGDAGAELGAGGLALIRLVHDPDAERRSDRAGLYHLALLYPSRRDLAEALLRLHAAGHPLSGASDHGVSEALYLSDPEENGIELYRDRPRDVWPRSDGRLSMTTLPLDLRELLTSAGSTIAEKAPGGTRLGHVHLHVTSLPEAEAFYGELGFDLVQRYGGQASFLSAGGYHHHVGITTWGPSRVPAQPGDAGLRWFEVVVPESGLPAPREVEDPSGNRIRLVSDRPAPGAP